MARPAKTVDIYNNHGEVITTTVKAFTEEYGAHKPHLYNKNGWTDEDGTAWRIGELPVFSKTGLFAEQQKVYNIFEQDYLFWVYTGKNRSGISIDELKEAIISYNHNFEMLDTHHFSNLYDVFTSKTDASPAVNLENYHHHDVSYGSYGSAKSWTTNDTIDRWLGEVEEEIALQTASAA